MASGRTEALCSADLVLGVGVTEMSKICHGRASGGSRPNERVSQSTQVTMQVKIIVSVLPAENKAVSDSLGAGGGCIFRCGLGNRPGGDKVEVF